MSKSHQCSLLCEIQDNFDILKSKLDSPVRGRNVYQTITLSLLLILPSFTFAESHWPQFRGPDGNGVASATHMPVEFSEEKNLDWKLDLPGKGWSSPVEADGKLWITTAIEVIATDEEREALLEKKGTNPKHYSARQIAKSINLNLLIVDRNSGELIANHELFEIPEPEAIHKLNSYASPTPVIDGDHIYCHFGTFGTVCLKRSDLSEVWRKVIPLVHSVGPGSSPFIEGDKLILICDGVDAQYVTALNKSTGEQVWKTDRPPMDAPDGDRKKAYCTPIATTDEAGRRQLICMGSQWLVSYDPATGDELWKVYHGTGFSVVPRPVLGHGMVYISTGFGKAQLWAIRIDGTGDVSDTHVAWKEKRGIPTKPSPLLVGDEIYVMADSGIASCFDAKTGENLWTARIPGNYSASPLYVDEKIYVASHEGDVTVFKPGREYTELAKSTLPGQFMASPLAIDRSFYLRSDKSLYRFTAKASSKNLSETR